MRQKSSRSRTVSIWLGRSVELVWGEPPPNQPSEICRADSFPATIDSRISDPRMHRSIVSSARYLRVTIRRDLKTADHTETVRKKGLRVLWMFKRSFANWTPELFLKLHTVYIRPILEYGSPAYYPCTQNELDRIEYVQQLGTRMIPSMRNLLYPERCERLNLYTLAYRKIRGDLIFLYRLVVRGEFPD